MARIDTSKLRALVGEVSATLPAALRVASQLERELERMVASATRKLESIPTDGSARDHRATQLMQRLEDSDYSGDPLENPNQRGAAAFIRLLDEIAAL